MSKVKIWSLLEAEEVCRQLSVNLKKGLSQTEVEQRLEKYGTNTLQETKKISVLTVFLNQFRDFMVLVLLAATLISGILGEYSDAITIIVIVIFNAILGFFQEFKAERSLAALKKLSAPRVTVLREGKQVEAAAEELVPGDIVFLGEGDRVSADIRLIAGNLSVNEAALTGESVPVKKDPGPQVEVPSSLGEYSNLIFTGTLITEGQGKGVVIATGMNTEVGRIADLIQGAEDTITPLQQHLSHLGKLLVASCIGVCFLVSVLGVIRGEPIYRMFMAGVSLAVAAIPEGMPAIVTICLALGVQRMIKRNAIVRRLPAVETLGCASVICSDKTGTLTLNRMSVQKIMAGDKIYTVTGEGYGPYGEFRIAKKRISPLEDMSLRLSLIIGCLCNSATLLKKGIEANPSRRGKAKNNGWDIQGDPTEGALLVAAAKAGIWKEDEEKKIKKVAEFPFNSERKRMSVVYSQEGWRVVYSKGAPEIILEKCGFYLEQGKIQPLTASKRRDILLILETMAAEGLRNIAVAYRELPVGIPLEEHEVENDLIFVGILGLMDPLRPEVLKAIPKCHRAGVRTVMITGDHRTTAMAVAKRLGILPKGGEVITGAELDGISDAQLVENINKIFVFARVNPAHKLKIVRAFKNKGHVVAMTGDGVNDAPAVKEADIGISMGTTGTDVTKEASSLILADDNFSTIVAAIEEGRSIYSNIRKFIQFLLSCNVGEILTMLLAMLAGLPLPLRPIQILWINLVTDGLPALALGVDPPEENIMDRPPRSPREGIFSGGLWYNILSRGSLIGATTIIVFAFTLFSTEELVKAQSMAFTTLIVTQLFYVFSCRRDPAVKSKVILGDNPYLILAVIFSFVLLAVALYHPLLQGMFNTEPLSVRDWLLILSLSIAPYLFSPVNWKMGRLLSRRVAILRQK